MYTLQGEELKNTVSRFIEVSSVTKNHTDKTKRNNRCILNRFVAFLQGRPLNLEAIEDYQIFLRTNTSKGKKVWAPNSINFEIKVIKTFIKYACKKQLIEKDFTSDIDMQKENEIDFEIPDVHTLVKIIYAGTEPNYSCIGNRGDNNINANRKILTRHALLFMLCTGWRLIEMKRLRKEDLFLNGDIPKVLVNQKGGNKKLTPISFEAVDVLKKVKYDDVVFPVTEAHCRKCLQRGCKKLGIKLRKPLTTHSLRRSFGTNLSNNGVNLFIVQKAMRHRSISTTQRYIRPEDRELSRIINTFHDINRQATNYEDKEQFYLSALQSMGIDKDSNINFTYTKNEQGELILKISERKQ